MCARSRDLFAELRHGHAPNGGVGRLRPHRSARIFVTQAGSPRR